MILVTECDDACHQRKIMADFPVITVKQAAIITYSP
jgi:hypothetical protein